MSSTHPLSPRCQAPLGRLLLRPAVAFLLISVAPAQSAKLSVVSGMKPGDGLHIGASTSDTTIDRCQFHYSTGATGPWNGGIPKVGIAPGYFAKLGPSLSPQGCTPAGSSHVGFAIDTTLPAGLPANLELRFKAVLWSSAFPNHREITGVVVVRTQPPAATPFLRWGVRAIGSDLYLRQWNVDTGALAHEHASSMPLGLTGVLVLPPVVSPTDACAAVPVVLGNGGGAVYVLRGVRSSPGQITEAWLPTTDPIDPSYAVEGTPQFFGDNELWVFESKGFSLCGRARRAYRFARYGWDHPTSTWQFLGSSAIGSIPTCVASVSIPTANWFAHPDGSHRAVCLAQSHDRGVYLYEFDASTGNVSSALLSIDGYTEYHCGFPGIKQVPATPWGMVQYGKDTSATSYLRLIDLATSVIGGERPVGNSQAGVSPGSLSSDGTLGVFRALTDNNPLNGDELQDAVPVQIAQPVAGQPPQTLPAVPSYFCGTEATVPGDGTSLLNASNGCADPVRLLTMDSSGTLQVELLCRQTPLNLVFQFEGGNAVVPAAFRVPGRNAIYAQLGTSLQLLDVSTMTYGSSVISLGSRFSTFYF